MGKRYVSELAAGLQGGPNLWRKARVLLRAMLGYGGNSLGQEANLAAQPDNKPQDG
jgi:hypothetical protein